MHVYFVRHGETELNRRYIHQSPQTPLSERGRAQSRTVAEYLRPMNPELIITSDYVRAQETARIIGSLLDVRVESDARFHEVVRPTSLCGLSLLHPKTLQYALFSVLRKNNARWRFEDAENFTDVHMRAARSLTYLESLARTHASIIVVSHTMYINLMVAALCTGRVLAIRDLLPAFLHIKEMQNGEVVGVKYVGKGNGRTCAWQLIHYAD